MSPNNNINKDEYLEYFKSVSNNLEDYKIVLKKALENALDIRKFEIELYWKRATYFWAFIAASFAGYFALMASDNEDYFSVVIISLLGLVFSISWFFVNKGSKYWQKNWEQHVDVLEDEVMGPLYKLIKDDSSYSFLNPISDYPISVSKINQLLSLFVTIIWMTLLGRSLKLSSPQICYGWIIVLITAIVIFIILFLYTFARSELSIKKEIVFRKRDTK